MRTFSTSVSEALAKKFGLNVTLFIGVEWSDGAEFFYCSEEFPGTKKALVSISGLETTKLVTGSGASQSVSVVLSDTEGDLTDILNTIDIHKRPAKVYMGFDNVPIDQSIALIEGEINSEMVWDEKARTLSFTILSKIEGRQFGFAVEDGLFEKVDQSVRSTPWPFRFGETCAYPAIKVRNGVQGILRLGQGVLDPTLDAKICQAQQIQCPLIEDPAADDAETGDTSGDGWLTKATAETKGLIYENPFSVNFSDIFGSAKLARPTNDDGETASTGLANPANGKPLIRDYECERAKFQTLCQLLRDRANQLVYVNDVLQIAGGEEFPQNRVVQIRIDDVIYTGVFVSESFTILSTNRLDTPTENVDCRAVTGPYLGYKQATERAPGNLVQCSQATNTYELRVIGGAGEAWRALEEMSDSSFKWLPSGSTVYLEDSSTEVHVASLIPGTVNGVFAYRTFADTRQLTELPTDYYQIVETDYGDLTAVEVHLIRSLESYPDEEWDDTIYVSFTSDIGPNPVDVIEWIIENYTDFTVDAANFATVKTYLTKYPCNYYHAVKENVLATVNQIAREARCALTITDNVVKLTYLPREPSAVKTFSENDLVNGTFRFKHSRTEELITSSSVTWQPWGASLLDVDEFTRRFTVEHNIEKYGYFGSEETYRTITDEQQALKTATFWSIRESNTWREVEFKTTLEHMNLELFDCVQLSISAFPSTKCVITGMTIDPSEGTVQFTAWTPILSGTQEKYFFAWPQSIANVPYPSNNYEVPRPHIVVTPPEGHPLYVETSDPAVAPTTGDRYPSDTDDVFPDTICQDMNDPELVDALAPIFNRIGWPTDLGIQATRADEVASNNPSFNFQEPDQNTVCGRPSLEACVWEVTVGYGTATNIALVENPGALGFNCGGIQPGGCKTFGQGQLCAFNGFFTWCKTFGSEAIAEAFAGVMNEQIRAAYCSWSVGNQGPLFVIGPIKKASDPSCVGMGNTEVGQGPGA